MVTPVLRVITASGESYDEPSWETLADVLSEMNTHFRFVILERLDREPADQHYMQVYMNDDYSCQVEYREGSADRHYQAHVPAPPEVERYQAIATVMDDWGHDRPGWRNALDWEPKPTTPPNP
jgi:hypothetical protein